MNRPPDDSPVFPLGLRKALMIACAVPAITAFVAVLIHHKGLVDVEQFGIPENYLYIGGLAVPRGPRCSPRRLALSGVWGVPRPRRSPNRLFKMWCHIPVTRIRADLRRNC